MRGVTRSITLGCALILVDGVHRGIPLLPAVVPAAVASFPFAYDDTRVYVPVRVAGSDTTWYFVLDTGAVPTIIDAGLARQLGVSATGTVSTSGAGRNQSREGYVSGVKFSVGGVALAPSSTAVSALDSILFPYSGRRTPGVIGSQFFSEHVVEMDFDERVARIYDPSGYEYHGAGTVVPLTFTNGEPTAQGTLTLPDGTRHAVRMVVDLGAKATMLITEPFERRIAMRDAFPKRVRATLGAGVGGETRYDFVRVPRLTVGTSDAVAISDFVAGMSAEETLRSDDYDALLGVEFLSRYRVIFDYARKRMILEPRTPMAAPNDADMSGLYLIMGESDPARVSVHRVLDGSPADQVGIRVGDVIESVNGQSTPGTSLWPWRLALRGGDGRRVAVVVNRAGEHLVKTITLRRLV